MPSGFSIVVPAFNSTESLQQLVEKIFSALSQHDAEVIIVDDGSSPPTWEKIKEIKSSYGDKVKGIRLGKNFGQHNATLCGIRYSTKQLVATIDDDLQFNPADLLQLYNTLCENNSELVYGIPVQKQQSVMRRAGYAVLKMSACLFREEVFSASSFRLMKSQLAQRLKENERYYVNIDVVLRFYTSAISYVPVTHYERVATRSGYSYAGLMHFAIRAMFAYSTTPFKLFILLFLLSLSFVFFFINDRLLGFTTVFVLLSFTVAVLSSVFILIYFYHLTGFMSSKPCYHISETI